MRKLHLHLLAAGLTITGLLTTTVVQASNVSQQINQYIDQIKQIRVSKDSTSNNQLLDAAWTYYNAHPSESVLLLKQALTQELSKKEPNQMLLLDAGYFLYGQSDAKAKAIAVDALELIDPNRDVIQANYTELFQFTHQVAGDHNPKVLPVIDRAFLTPEQVSIFIPQHVFTIDRLYSTVFLYGVYSPKVETYLTEKLNNPATRLHALETLTSLGTEQSIPAMQKLLNEPHIDKDTFTRIVGVAMRVGGEAGKRLLLNVDTSHLSADALSYYQKIKPSIQEMSFQSITKRIGAVPKKSLSDAQVIQRLDRMIAKHGVDRDTQPSEVIFSTVPRAVLLDKLVQIRQQTLYRISDEALYDVDMSNVIINTIGYKQDK